MPECRIADHNYLFSPRVSSECGYTEDPKSPLKTWRVKPSIPLPEPEWYQQMDGIDSRFTDLLHTFNKISREAILSRRREALKSMVQLREEAIREGMALRTINEINKEVARRRGAKD